LAPPSDFALEVAVELSLVALAVSAPLPDPPPVSALEVEAASLDPDPPLSVAAERDASVRCALVARSFFAQPEPLKTMDGALKPFRIVPSAPHAGQNFGPASSRPWMTSVRWWQVEQM